MLIVAKVNLNSELDKTVAIEIAEALDFDVLVDENSDTKEKEADIKEAIKNIDISQKIPLVLFV